MQREIGLNVDVQTMEWSAMLSRRFNTDPPEAGGWSDQEAGCLDIAAVKPQIALTRGLPIVVGGGTQKDRRRVPRHYLLHRRDPARLRAARGHCAGAPDWGRAIGLVTGRRWRRAARDANEQRPGVISTNIVSWLDSGSSPRTSHMCGAAEV